MRYSIRDLFGDQFSPVDGTTIRLLSAAGQPLQLYTARNGGAPLVGPAVCAAGFPDLYVEDTQAGELSCELAYRGGTATLRARTQPPTISVIQERPLTIRHPDFAGGHNGDPGIDATAALAAIKTVAARRPVVLEQGTYRVSAPPVFDEQIVTGEGHRQAIIEGTDPAKPVIIAQGEGCKISELTIRHAALPGAGVAAKDGCGIRCMNLYDRSQLERLIIENVTSGIYCKEPWRANGDESGTCGIFSTAIRDIRVRQFRRAILELSSQNAGNTGCTIDNVYSENTANLAAGIIAKFGYHFANFDDLEVRQINCEWGLYERGLEINSCPTIRVSSFHVEGYEAGAGYDAVVRILGTRTHAVHIGPIHIKSSKFDAARIGNGADYGMFRIDDAPFVQIGGVFTEGNTKIGAFNWRQFYSPLCGAAQKVYLRGNRKNAAEFNSGDFNSQAGVLVENLA